MGASFYGNPFLLGFEEQPKGTSSVWGYASNIKRCMSKQVSTFAVQAFPLQDPENYDHFGGSRMEQSYAELEAELSARTKSTACARWQSSDANTETNEDKQKHTNTAAHTHSTNWPKEGQTPTEMVLDTRDTSMGRRLGHLLPYRDSQESHNSPHFRRTS